MVYAEWRRYGVFDNGIFTSWTEYHAATFNPDTEILLVKEI